MMADIWRKILGRTPSDPSNEGGQSKEEGNTRGKRGKKTEEGKKEIGGGANEKGGGNTKKEEEERPFLESGGQSKEEGNTRGKRGEKTEEGKKEIGGGANEKRGGNTKKEEEERPSLESDPNYERHLLDIKIVPENTTPEILKELSDEMDRMCSKYLKNKGMSNHFFDYLKRCHNVMVETLTGGCIKITVQCPTLDSLENLWSATLSGHLDKAAETYLLTSTIKTKLGVDTVKFKVTIKEEDYSACKMSFLQLSGGQKEEEKSKEIEKKTSTGEREGGGTKEIKDAKKEEKEWRFPESGGQKEEEKSEEIEKKTSTVEGEGGGTKEIKDAKKEENQWRSLEFSYALRETLKLKDVEKSKLEVFPSIKLLIKRWHEELKGYALRETPSLEDVKESEQKSTQIKPPIKKWYSEQQATDEKPRHDRSLSERGDILLGKEELVSKAVLSNFKLMDRLKNYLDKSVRGIKNWRMLAYLHGFRKEQLIWRLGEKYSRSEMMFEALICENPNLLMTTLAQHLEALNINDVADYIVALKLSVKETVAEFFEFQNLNNTGKVLEMLDLIEEDKWWRLGIKIEVDDRMLKRISIECGNRQHELRGDVIDVILASHPFDTIQQLKDDFEGMAPWEIYSILRELLGELTSDELPYSEYFWEIARMIRYSFFSEVGALPAVYEISREAYEGLQLLFAISPTQKTIEAIVKHDPNFTVGQLFMDLSYMGRLDVIKAISPNYEWK